MHLDPIGLAKCGLSFEGRDCDGIEHNKIDNLTDCNLIFEGLLEVLGYSVAVRRFNGNLKGTERTKSRRTWIHQGDGRSFKEMFTLIVVGNSELDSNIVLSAQELEERYGLFVNEKRSMINHPKKYYATSPPNVR